MLQGFFVPLHREGWRFVGAFLLVDLILWWIWSPLGWLGLLATLWWTSGSSGIDPPHGRSPQWKVVEIVKDPAQSKIPEIRDIANDLKTLRGSRGSDLRALP